jgi:hypothetical protein
VGWIPNYNPDLAPDRPVQKGFESHPTRQNEIFHACYRALLSEFSDCEPEAEVIPWGDGIMESIVSQCSASVVLLVISRKQTAQQARVKSATGA